MKLRATQHGEHPKGLHWVAGEVRDLSHLDLDPSQLPPWLERLDKPQRGKTEKG